MRTTFPLPHYLFTVTVFFFSCTLEFGLSSNDLFDSRLIKRLERWRSVFLRFSCQPCELWTIYIEMWFAYESTSSSKIVSLSLFILHSYLKSAMHKHTILPTRCTHPNYSMLFIFSDLRDECLNLFLAISSNKVASIAHVDIDKWLTLI